MTILFPHLHVHTSYSLSESSVKLSQIAKTCKKRNIPAIAIADNNNLFGLWDAQDSLLKEGIQPIIGMQVSLLDFDPYKEYYIKRPNIVLLVKNEIGYKNILKLASNVFLNNDNNHSMLGLRLEDIKEFSEGLICLSGGTFGPIDNLFAQGRENEASDLCDDFLKIFNDDFFIETQIYPHANFVNSFDFLLDLSIKKSVAAIATNEVFFLNKDEYEAEDILLCISEGRYVHENNRRKISKDNYLKSAKEMHELFANFPTLIENTINLAKKCTFIAEKREINIPSFLPSKMDEEKLLLDLATEGLEHKFKILNVKEKEKETYRKRLDFELEIITKMGFPGYFLIVSDFIKWAKDNNIPVGPGRGSGAGSLVAYVIGITNINPIQFGLIFERFLNPERVSLPDFDIDFCQDKRDEVISYVKSKYGKDNVAHIITYGTLKPRAVLRDVGRVYSIPFPTMNEICKLVPNNPSNPLNLTQSLKASPDLKKMIDSSERYQKIFSISQNLEGLHRHASTHAAGVVISDSPLTNVCALYHDGKTLLPATQYSMKYVDYCGLIKFDFLGLKTLTIIDQTIKMIGDKDLCADNIDTNDPEIYKLMSTGKTTGVFQLESTGMQDTLRKAKPKNIGDVIALISLYRPGPMENIPLYIENKRNKNKIKYDHPILKNILEETYGVIVYQEQVMQIARDLALFSMGDADLLRRAIGKKKIDEILAQKKKFMDGAKKNNIPSSLAENIYSFIEKFGGYGFNKSHAAAYAVIGCQCAWLKNYYPAFFFSSCMNLDMNNTDKIAHFILDARNFGIEIVPPCINSSESEFYAKDNKIFFALSAIKGVGKSIMENIVTERKKNGNYTDIYNFLKRVPHKNSGRKVIEILALAGAFDNIHANRNEIFENAELLSKWAELYETEASSNQIGLFNNNQKVNINLPTLKGVKKFTSTQKLQNEYEKLGLFLSGHPLTDFCKENDIKYKRNLSLFYQSIIDKKSTGGTIFAYISKINLRYVRGGKILSWVTISDETMEIEVMAFDKEYNDNKDLLVEGNLVRLFLKKYEREDDFRLTIANVRKLNKQNSIIKDGVSNNVYKNNTSYLAHNNHHKETIQNEPVQNILSDNEKEFSLNGDQNILSNCTSINNANNETNGNYNGNGSNIILKMNNINEFEKTEKILKQLREDGKISPKEDSNLKKTEIECDILFKDINSKIKIKTKIYHEHDLNLSDIISANNSTEIDFEQK